MQRTINYIKLARKIQRKSGTTHLPSNPTILKVFAKPFLTKGSQMLRKRKRCRERWEGRGGGGVRKLKGVGRRESRGAVSVLGLLNNYLEILLIVRAKTLEVDMLHWKQKGV